MGLTCIMFFAELIGGYYSGSISLVADSFHMLSDVAALFVAWYAIEVPVSQLAIEIIKCINEIQLWFTKS